MTENEVRAEVEKLIRTGGLLNVLKGLESVVTQMTTAGSLAAKAVGKARETYEEYYVKWDEMDES